MTTAPAPELPASTLALLTPAMRSVVRGMALVRRAPLHTLSPAQARAAYAAAADVLEIPPAPLARVQELHIPARDATPLPLRLYVPHTSADAPTTGLPLLLYLHGGGFTLGSIATHDRLCRSLAQRAQCMLASLDYRLAPEYPFPTAHNDAWDALQWLHRHAPSLGADAQRLAVGGDSAGGTLAAACAIHARDAGLALRLQLLIYPGTSAWQDTASHQRFAHGPVIDAASIQWFFNHYARDAASRQDWRFAPQLAHELHGLAPALFILAEVDPLVDEGIAYADQLRMAAVDVSLEIYRGVTHEFLKMGRAVPEALQAHADIAAALQKAFA